MSTTPGQQTTWLTQEAYDRLSAELEDAKGPKRADIVAKIEAARDEGDLKENGGYHAAKDEQGKNEARIRQLTQMLERAVVGAAPAASGVAGPGMVLEVAYGGDKDDTERFLLGSREDTAAMPVYSAQSPLGLALTGAKVGDTVGYALPERQPDECRAAVGGALLRLIGLQQAPDVELDRRAERHHRAGPPHVRAVDHPVEHGLQVGVVARCDAQQQVAVTGGRVRLQHLGDRPQVRDDGAVPHSLGDLQGDERGDGQPQPGRRQARRPVGNGARAHQPVQPRLGGAPGDAEPPGEVDDADPLPGHERAQQCGVERVQIEQGVHPSPPRAKQTVRPAPSRT